MARKKDPVGAVVDWFQGADLAQAELLLAVVTRTVKARAALEAPVAVARGKAHKAVREAREKREATGRPEGEKVG